MGGLGTPKSGCSKQGRRQHVEEASSTSASAVMKGRLRLTMPATTHGALRLRSAHDVEREVRIAAQAVTLAALGDHHQHG
jgi:hypothetical protein